MSETQAGIEEPIVDSKRVPPVSAERKQHKNPLADRALGLTMPTKIPGTNEDRGLVERFERAKLFEAFMEVKKSAEARVADRVEDWDLRNLDLSESEQKKLRERRRIEARKNDPEFKVFREKAAALQANLDILNRQFYENQTRVHVDDPKLGVHDIPVVTLDLNPPKEGEKDERIHTVVVGTYISNPHQIAAFAESLALEGQVVDVMTYPEKYEMSGSSPDWLKIVKKDGTLRPYVKLFEKVAEGISSDDINLVGMSMGAPIVMEMAADPEFAGRINNLTVMEPPSLVGKSGKRLVFDFLRDSLSGATREQIVKAALSSQRPVLPKSMKGAETVVAPILGKAQVTAEMIERINPKGKFQVWVGDKSAVTGWGTRNVLMEAEMRRMSDHSDYSPMKLFVIEGGHHQTLFSTLGIASYITQEEDPKGTIIPIRLEDLATNGAQSILRGI